MDRDTAVKKLRRFKEKVIADIPISHMYFFGSRVTGKPTKYSDIDLVIVSPYFNKLNFFKRGAKMYDYWDSRYPVDFLCYTPKEFNRLKSQVTIVKEATETGMEI